MIGPNGFWKANLISMWTSYLAESAKKNLCTVLCWRRCFVIFYPLPSSSPLLYKEGLHHCTPCQLLTLIMGFIQNVAIAALFGGAYISNPDEDSFRRFLESEYKRWDWGRREMRCKCDVILLVLSSSFDTIVERLLGWKPNWPQWWLLTWSNAT